MDIRTLARLRSVCQSLTPAQQAQLLAIVQCRIEVIITPVCESLVALGLVRLNENKYMATEDGRYVASLR